MTRPARTLRSPLAAAGLVAAAAIASLSPAPAAAADAYDVDCKLILCLPAGFPSGCNDAYSRMVDRLRHGHSPIGVCTMSDGTEYESYDIDYRIIPATRPEGWECPLGKTLYHSTSMGDNGAAPAVTAFCYDRAYSYGGNQDVQTRYTNMTAPQRFDFKVKLTTEAGTPAAWSEGWKSFNAGIARDN